MKAGIYDNSTLNSSDEDLSVSQLHFSVLQRASSKAVFYFFIFLFSETKSSFNGPSVLPAEASVFMSSLNTKQTKKRRQRASSVSTIKNSRVMTVIDRYRNVIKLCHFMVNLHSVLHSVWSWYLWKTLTAPLETDETKGSWIVEDSCVSAIMSPPMSGWYGIYQ